MFIEEFELLYQSGKTKTEAARVVLFSLCKRIGIYIALIALISLSNNKQEIQECLAIVCHGLNRESIHNNVKTWLYRKLSLQLNYNHTKCSIRKSVIRKRTKIKDIALTTSRPNNSHKWQPLWNKCSQVATTNQTTQFWSTSRWTDIIG